MRHGKNWDWSRVDWPIFRAGFCVGAGIVLILWGLFGAWPAHADPTCGPGSYWDWKHEICSAFPVPPPAPCEYTSSCHDPRSATLVTTGNDDEEQ